MQWNRKEWLSLLAKSEWERLASCLPDFQNKFLNLREPEVGAVMVQGRAGGTGKPFNVGEVTVTRASVQLESGEQGHGYVRGRNKDKALAIAKLDALLQTEAYHSLADQVLVPLQAAYEASHKAIAEKAEATKVDFFTLVRGED